MGFDGLAPDELLGRARAEALRYGVDIRAGIVDRIEQAEDGVFDVFADEPIRSRTVVLATGLIDELPPLSGLSEVWGNDLRVCPCFDGYEVRDQRFVVFGLPERLVHMASWVSMWSPRVSVVSQQTFNAADSERLRLLNIAIINDEVTGLVHREDGRLVAVSTRSGANIACDATWVAMRYRAASNLAASLGDVDETGLAITDAGGRMSRPGVFAVGNARSIGVWDHLAQAAASGTTVGPLVTMYLLESRINERSAAA